MIDYYNVTSREKKSQITGNRYDSYIPYSPTPPSKENPKIRSTIPSGEYLGALIRPLFVAFEQPQMTLVESKFAPFVESAQIWAESGNDQRGIELVLEASDDFFHAGEFKEIDTFLMVANPVEYSVEINVSLLAATLPAALDLPHRDAYLNRVTQYFEQSNVPDIEGLLNGF